MGDQDIQILAFAEKDANPNSWNLDIEFDGNCKIGCVGTRMLRTKNLVAALAWAEHHRKSSEHQARLEANRMAPVTINGMVFTSSNGEETQP